MGVLRCGTATASLLLVTTGLVACDRAADPPSPPDPDATTSSATSSVAASATTEVPFDEVAAQVADRVAVYDGIATGVVALVRVGEQTEAVTGGLAQVAPERPMRAGQTFPIASVTKPMTATLVLQLVDEGRLDLDDDLRTLLPALERLDTPITVEQVLSHRSGLASDATPADVRRHGLRDTAGLVREAVRRGLEFTPGSDGRYSNLGFAALGLLVEEVLDQPLGRALAERVLGPAGMDSSSLGEAPDVQGYDRGKPVRNYYLDYLPGAGSVVATAGDVDRFFRALWTGALLPEDLVRQMAETRGQVQVGATWRLDYGLGLMRWTTRCGTAVGHSGRIGGFTVEAWTLEGSERSTVVSVNDQDADQVARGIAEAALCGSA